VENLPVEFMRKGRFDEIFFVDLPEENERAEIFKIQLQKRNKYHPGINLSRLAALTIGFCGTDIEEVTRRIAEKLFIDKKTVAKTEDLENIIKKTKPVTATMGDKIDAIREKADSIGTVRANGKEF
jgi:SpoVK/Ycf46/Vps4 family AAA+-type ATPase